MELGARDRRRCGSPTSKLTPPAGGVRGRSTKELISKEMNRGCHGESGSSTETPWSTRRRGHGGEGALIGQKMNHGERRSDPCRRYSAHPRLRMMVALARRSSPGTWALGDLTHERLRPASRESSIGRRQGGRPARSARLEKVPRTGDALRRFGPDPILLAGKSPCLRLAAAGPS